MSNRNSRKNRASRKNRNSRKNRDSRRNRKNRNSRRNRRNNRMATMRRNNMMGAGLLTNRLYGPAHEVVGFGKNVTGTLAGTAQKFVNTGLNGINRLGRSVTGRTNAALSKLLSRRRRNTRKN